MRRTSALPEEPSRDRTDQKSRLLRSALAVSQSPRRIAANSHFPPQVPNPRRTGYSCAGTIFVNEQASQFRKQKALKSFKSDGSCVLTRQKLQLSPDKLRFMPDDTKMKAGWDGRIRTYGTLYQKQLPYHLATSQQRTARYCEGANGSSPVCKEIRHSLGLSSRKRSSVVSMSLSASTILSSASLSLASTVSTTVFSAISGCAKSRVSMIA